ncbi:MAG: hypothetical protein ACRD4P_17965 [Bryobacteraceae bacterium]
MAQTLFDAVHGRLLSLIPRFGLEKSAPVILDAYNLICGESLSLPVGKQRPEMCRINRDGTAIQFSLALSHSRPAPLQFLGEAGAPGLSYTERISRSLEAIHEVAGLLGARDELEAISDLLHRMTPRDESALPEHGPGAYWIGVSFQVAGAPALTIYVNSRLSSELGQWERMNAFTHYFGGLDTWRLIEPELRGRMSPLGMAVTVSPGRPASGRVYFSAYGLGFDYYRGLLLKANDSEDRATLYDRYIDAMVGEDRRYPARSAVWSVEFETGRDSNIKFELCAHCAFSSDAEAATRCESWLVSQGFDAELYRDTAKLLTASRRLSNTTPPELHAYTGVGQRRGESYSTVYLNPGPFLAG